jgi:hypothetical protein
VDKRWLKGQVTKIRSKKEEKEREIRKNTRSIDEARRKAGAPQGSQ